VEQAAVPGTTAERRVSAAIRQRDRGAAQLLEHVAVGQVDRRAPPDGARAQIQSVHLVAAGIEVRDDGRVDRR
jgi:hypothetical protein